jgi:hypothetical protein
MPLHVFIETIKLPQTVNLNFWKKNKFWQNWEWGMKCATDTTSCTQTE